MKTRNFSTVTRYLHIDRYLLGHFEPSLLEAEDGAAVERRRDLQDGVVVVEAAADVGNRHPLLDDCHPHVDVVPLEDLCGDPVTDLKHTVKSD